MQLKRLSPLYKLTALPTSATDGLAPLLRGEAAAAGGAHRGGHRPARARLGAARQYRDVLGEMRYHSYL